MPAAQRAQADEPTAEAVDPATQSAQLDAPEAAAILPSAHCRQDAAPVDPWYHPAEHMEHVDVELDAENCPVAQLVQKSLLEAD